MRFRIRTLLFVVAIVAVIAAVLKPKPRRYELQSWEGGPHIIIPNAVADVWNGGRVDPFADEADYGRACEVGEDGAWFGLIKVGDAEGLVLSNPPFAAWDRGSTKSTHYFFKIQSWGDSDFDNGGFDELLDRAKAIQLDATDKTWHVPKGDAFMIFAADGPSGNVAGRIDISNLEGTYRISTGNYRRGKDDVLVLRLDRID